MLPSSAPIVVHGLQPLPISAQSAAIVLSQYYKAGKMDTFVLRVKRQSGFVAAAVSTKVLIDGVTQACLRVGSGKEFTLPRRTVTVTLHTPVALGKDIDKTVTIAPENFLNVTLLFTYKVNKKSLLPLGSFIEQTAIIETEVIHGPSVTTSQGNAFSSETTNASASAQSQQPASTPRAVKYCTECGTQNPKGAKFCQGCGNKF